MATDWLKETRKTSEKVRILQNVNAVSMISAISVGSLSSLASINHLHFGDQLQHYFGTSRRSEIYAKVGGKGEPYEQILNEYLDTL